MGGREGAMKEISGGVCRSMERERGEGREEQEDESRIFWRG